MAPINQEAIQELKTAIDALIPDPLEPGVEAVVTLTAASISPTGLGGFIQLNEEKTGDILGRRVQAMAAVFLESNNPDNLQQSATAVTEAFMGMDRQARLENNILAMNQISSEYSRLRGSDRQIELRFKVLYEYKQIPEETQDIISEIPINLGLDGAA